MSVERPAKGKATKAKPKKVTISADEPVERTEPPIDQTSGPSSSHHGRPPMDIFGDGPEPQSEDVAVTEVKKEEVIRLRNVRNQVHP